MPPIDFSNIPKIRENSVLELFTHSSLRERIIFGLVILCVIGFFFWYNISAPRHYPTNELAITVTKGESITEIANNLESIGAIRSPIVFRVLYSIFGDSTIKSGRYTLPKNKVNTLSLLRSMINQSPEDLFIKITIPEGMTINEIGKIIKQAVPNFDLSQFNKKAAVYEGYLFPDTYFVELDLTPEVVIKVMNDNFYRKTTGLLQGVDMAKLADIITMASILEEEGSNYENRQIIAGILYKRLRANIALQVDATFVYVNGKKTGITKTDLEIDSPFNTYKNRGLPPHPISNPGLESIKAALNPVESPYLYYLSDSKSNLYYAKTFEEHKVNREKYLNK